MPLLNLFFSKKKTPANIAKERLNIIVSESKLINNNIPHSFYKLKYDLLEVIYKYMKINPNTISIYLKKKDKNQSILELNIILNEIKKINKK